MKNQILNGREADFVPFREAFPTEYVPVRYPAMKHHPDGRTLTVLSPEQEEMLGDGWYDSPADFPPVAYSRPRPKDGCEACSGLYRALDEQEATFAGRDLELSNQAAELVRENAELRAELEDLKRSNTQLAAANCSLTTRMEALEAEAVANPEVQSEPLAEAPKAEPAKPAKKK